MAKKRPTPGRSEMPEFQFVEVPLPSFTQLHPEFVALLLRKLFGAHGAKNQRIHNRIVTNDSLEEVHTVEPNLWQADTNLFTSQWSSSFAHGADTLLPAGLMLEKIFGKDEKLVTIDSLRWQKLIRENMLFTASTTPFDSKQTESSLMTASFTTNQGRKLHVRGDGNGKEIQGIAPRNPVAEKLFSRSPDQCKSNKQGWHEYPLGQYDHLSDEQIVRPGMTMSTAVDLINYAVLFCNELKHYDCTGTRLFLGVKDFTVPDVLRTSRIRVQLQHSAVKNSPKRFTIVPVKVEYLDSGRDVLGGGLCYFAFPQDEEAEREFERELHAEK